MYKSFKRLWPYLRPHRGQICLMFATSLLLGLLSGIQPILIKLLTDQVWKGKEPIALDIQWKTWIDLHLSVPLMWFPLSFPLLFLTKGVFRYLQQSRLIFLGDVVIAKIRQRLINQFVRLNLTFHNSFEGGSGGLISRILNDMMILQHGLFHYGDFVTEPIMIIGLFGYMVYIDWRLTLAVILFLPVFAMVMRQISKSLRRFGNHSRIAMDDVTSTIKESLDGVRVIQSFNLENEIQRRFDVQQDTYLRARRNIIFREEVVSPLNEFLASLLVMGFVIYSAKAIIGGTGSEGDFFSFILAAGLIQPSLKKLQEASVRLQQTVVVVERMFSIIESTASVPQINNPMAFPKDWKTIRFKDVTFSYGGENVLKSVNVTIHKGEIVALVGESGSGKSTLVNLLGRFFDPTSGEIWIDQTLLTDIDLQDLRRNIALVTQDVFLFRDSIERNIQAGDYSRDMKDVKEAAQLANAHNFIMNIEQNYKTNVGDRGNLLSGGEKQRVSIARAIFKNAPVLILDEATSALDSVSEMEVQKGLTQLMKGRTAFVIAHRLSTVFSADRILVMKKGEIVEQGSHQALLDQGGEYFNFFQLQMNHQERAKII